MTKGYLSPRELCGAYKETGTSLVYLEALAEQAARIGAEVERARIVAEAVETANGVAALAKPEAGAGR